MLFTQIKTADRQPEKSRWFNTDRGNLYWFAEEKEWSCWSHEISYEYPSLWYEPVTQLSDSEIEKMALIKWPVNMSRTIGYSEMVDISKRDRAVYRTGLKAYRDLMEQNENNN